MFAYTERRESNNNVLQKAAEQNKQHYSKLTGKQNEGNPQFMALPGFASDGVRVHCNFEKSFRLQEPAYTQGTQSLSGENNMVIQRYPKKIEGNQYFDTVYTKLKLTYIKANLYRVNDTGQTVYYEDDIYDIVRITNEETNEFDYTDTRLDLTKYSPAPVQKDHFSCSIHCQIVKIGDITPCRDEAGCPRMETEVGGRNIVEAMQAGTIFNPVQINLEYNIIDGNHRYYASLQCGYKEIPVEIVK